MADNSFSSVPPKPSSPSEAASSHRKNKNISTRLDVLKVPSDFEKTRQAPQGTQRLEGRVTQVDPKTNRVRIRTPVGEFDVQYPKDHPLPTKASQVEIKIALSKTGIKYATISGLAPQAQKPDQLQLQTPPPAKPIPYQSPNIDQVAQKNAAAPIAPSQGQSIKLIPLQPADIQSIQVKLPAPLIFSTLQTLLHHFQSTFLFCSKIFH